MSGNRINVLGIGIDPVTMPEVEEWVRRHILSSGSDRQIVVVNVAKLVKAREQEPLRKAIEEAELVTVDGMPIVWYSRLLPGPLPERVSGIDIMFEMFRSGDRKGWSFYLLGATEKVIHTVVEKLHREYPNAKVKGFRNGYFTEEEESGVVADIRGSGANILLLGFGSPRKESFVERWKGEFGVNVIHGVGGSFDVYAGVTERAPVWMQNAGLEWLYRLRQEPVRLFPRYAVTNTKFLLLMLKDRFGFRTRTFEPRVHR